MALLHPLIPGQDTGDQIGEVNIYQDTGYRRSNRRGIYQNTGYRRSNRRGKYTRIQDTGDQIGEVIITEYNI